MKVLIGTINPFIGMCQGEVYGAVSLWLLDSVSKTYKVGANNE
ncbi:MAG: hypothetical protein RR891_07730 [Clostridium sp.]